MKAMRRSLNAIVNRLDDARRSSSLGVRLREAARTLGRNVNGAGTVYAPHTLHEIRIAAKKLRYVVELAGERVPGTLRRLRALQSALGRLHDAQVLQHRIQELAATVRDRGLVATLTSMERTIESTCREWHAGVLKTFPATSELATAIAREVPVSIRPRTLGRPVKMAGARITWSRSPPPTQEDCLMPVLYLVRHAIAADRGPKYPKDDERPLTREGKSRMKAVVAGWRKLAPDLDLILTSPLVRAQSTAEIVRNGLRGRRSGRALSRARAGSSARRRRRGSRQVEEGVGRRARRSRARPRPARRLAPRRARAAAVQEGRHRQNRRRGAASQSKRPTRLVRAAADAGQANATDD